jgi:alpha/beta hydrolase fold
MRHNTTDHLVSDMERLREHLGIDRWLLTGGSWGTTLALVHAERYPHRVSQIMLSAISTTRRSEIDWLYRGVALFFPEEWERFRDGAGGTDRDGDLVAAYARLMESSDPQVRNQAASSWGTWARAPGRERNCSSTTIQVTWAATPNAPGCSAHSPDSPATDNTGPYSAASWPTTRSASTMSPDQPQAPQKQTKTRSVPVQYSVISPWPPWASDNAAAHAGQYFGASRRCRSASWGNQPRARSGSGGPSARPDPAVSGRTAVTRPPLSGFPWP